jgi:hypothetical protein
MSARLRTRILEGIGSSTRYQREMRPNPSFDSDTQRHCPHGVQVSMRHVGQCR